MPRTRDDDYEDDDDDDRERGRRRDRYREDDMIASRAPFAAGVPAAGVLAAKSAAI